MLSEGQDQSYFKELQQREDWKMNLKACLIKYACMRLGIAPLVLERQAIYLC